MAGFDNGSISLAQIPYSLRPSILAASSSSLGIPIKNCLIRNTPMAVNACIRIMPRWLSVRPNSVIILYWGTM